MSWNFEIRKEAQDVSQHHEEFDVYGKNPSKETPDSVETSEMLLVDIR